MEQRDYLKQHLREVLRVIDSCLEAIYAGGTHMYRPLAGQLRILLCDTQRKEDNSLLAATYPRLEVSALASISWSDRQTEHVELRQPPEGTARIAQMPFEITICSGRLAVADLQLARSTLIPIKEWSAQTVTVYPTRLTVFDIVRSIADKGGGSHVDAQASPALRYMSQKTPAGGTFAEMFVLALGRFVQRLGEQLFDYKGVRIPDSLLGGPIHKLNLMMMAHREWADAQEAIQSGSPRELSSMSQGTRWSLVSDFAVHGAFVSAVWASHGQAQQAVA